MRRISALLLLGSLGLVLSSGFATARDSSIHGGRTIFRPGGGFGGGHGHWRPHRWPAFPAYLHGRRGDVTVVIQQTFVSAPVVPAVPTILDLPASAGIRETVAPQPAVIVVNERSGARVSGAVRVLSSGPKILGTIPGSEGGSQAPATPSAFGARIVHLTVPSGR